MRNQWNHVFWYHHHFASWRHSSDFEELFEVLYRKFNDCNKQVEIHANKSTKELLNEARTDEKTCFFSIHTFDVLKFAWSYCFTRYVKNIRLI